MEHLQDNIKRHKHFNTLAIGACIFFFILALVLGNFHKVGNFGVETDFYGAYTNQAKNIMEGQPFTYQHNPPGYAALLGIFSIFTGDMFVAGKIISALSVAFFGLVTYLLFKSLFGFRIALNSMIFLLIAMIPYSFLASTDILAALLITLSLWVFLLPSIMTPKRCFLTGISAGFAYLIRYNALFVVIGIGFALLFINPDKYSLKRRFLMLGIFIFGALLITSPWLVINWQTNGSPFASTAYLQIAAHFHHNLDDTYGTSLRQMALRFNSLKDVFSQNPIKITKIYLSDVFYKNIEKLATQGLGFPLYFFAGAGLFLLIRNATRRRMIYFFVCILGYLLLGLVGFYLRYYFFFLPVLFLLVNYFLFDDVIFKTLKNLPYLKLTVRWAAVIVFAACLSINAVYRTWSGFSNEPRYLLKIADFLKERSSPDDIIIVRKPHLAYLSGLKYSFPLCESPDEYYIKMKEIEARYIVYSDYEAILWPGLKFLSDPAAAPKGFHLIYEHKPTNSLIYEFEN